MNKTHTTLFSYLILQWCGRTGNYCGVCCQNGPCTWINPNPPPPPPPRTNITYNANHGEDSRLIAYVGNWQACPTQKDVAAYSHIIIAFAVTYTWHWDKNACDKQCNVGSVLPVCGNANNQNIINQWRAAGKKVILSFGGAGMGGSWAGDTNNCWDYCFGKEEQIANRLTSIVKNKMLDGVDIDYEYCYDIEGTTYRPGYNTQLCNQRDKAIYTDAKAQNFLNTLTSKLRVKLDALQASNGYDRGRYIVTHAPMDSDLTTTAKDENGQNTTSKYFQILKARRDDLDFLMPQFYNGVTRPGRDGIDGRGSNISDSFNSQAVTISAADLFSSLANDLFDREPNKVSSIDVSLENVDRAVLGALQLTFYFYRLSLAFASLTAAAQAQMWMRCQQSRSLNLSRSTINQSLVAMVVHFSGWQRKILGGVIRLLWKYKRQQVAQ